MLSRATGLRLEGCKVSFGRNLVPGGKRSESAREAGQHLVGFRPSWRAFQRAEDLAWSATKSEHVSTVFNGISVRNTTRQEVGYECQASESINE